MNRAYLKAVILSLAATGWNCTALAEEWGYTGETGPAKWSELDAKYLMCSMGRNQSPIDLSDFVESDLKSLELDYKSEVSDIVNNGHTVQVNYGAGSSLALNGHAFELKQFHFHSPSENHINGEAFPMEAHLVHADENGNLAVVAVMFKEDEPNPLLTELWRVMPTQAETKALPSGLSIEQMLPSDRDYYRFNGSLTTPPCSEGVFWMVLKQPATASKAQVEQFSKTIGFSNNRPLRSVYARPVLQ